MQEKSQSDLGLRKHINEPTADSTIGAARDQIVGVLGADHLDCINWMGMPSCRQGGLQDRQMFRPIIPKQNLTGIGASKY